VAGRRRRAVEGQEDQNGAGGLAVGDTERGKSDLPLARTLPADAAASPHQTPPGYDGLASTEPASRRYYAALDLGTNNCRLLVAQPTRRGFKVKTSFSRIIRLGEGLSASGRLSEDAIARTIDALKVCAGK